jgi:hypothetical protein
VPVSKSPFATSGAGAPTVHSCVAGAASTFPAASTARTAKRCAPGASCAYACGEAQAAKPAPSSPHSNRASASPAVNENAASVAVVVAGGAAVIVVSGASVSAGAETAHSRSAGVASAVPAASTARTWKRCGPAARPV